jgi:hypothetical protein
VKTKNSKFGLDFEYLKFDLTNWSLAYGIWRIDLTNSAIVFLVFFGGKFSSYILGGDQKP